MKEWLHIPPSSRTGGSPSVAVECHIQDTGSLWPINWTPTGTITLNQNEPGSKGNKRVLHIPQNSRAETTLSNGLMSYLAHLLEGVYPSAEMQSAYSTASADWAVDREIPYYTLWLVWFGFMEYQPI